MTPETVTLPLDNGGQGWFHAVMANQRLSDGEPPILANGELPRPEVIGEPLDCPNCAALRAEVRRLTAQRRPAMVEPRKTADLAALIAKADWFAMTSEQQVAEIERMHRNLQHAIRQNATQHTSASGCGNC